MSNVRGMFSIRRNVRYLLTPPGGRFRPVDGLRAFAVLWVIVMHCAWWQLPFRSPEDFREHMEAAPHWVIGGPYGVDVFFVISGFLIAHYLMSEYRESGSIAIGNFYLRRFLKLMPAYIAALVVYAFFMRTNRGMIWTNLLYINNFVPGEKQAMPWTWSLAIEEQFYFTFPCFLAFVFFRLKRGRVALLAGGILVSCAIRAWIAAGHGMRLPIQWSLSVTDPRFLDWAEALYIKPYTRFGGLALGVLAAYLYLFRDIERFFRRHAALAAMGFVLSIALAAGIVEAPVHFDSARWGALSSVVVLALHENALAACFGYVLLFSLFPVNAWSRGLQWFLSRRIWYVVAQLAYSAYLLHPMVLVAMYMVVAPRGINRFPMPVYYVLGPMLSLVAASILYIAVERPFTNLRSSQALPQRRQPTAELVEAAAAQV